MKGEVVCLSAMKACRAFGGLAPLILNLGARRRWVADRGPLSFYPWERTKVPIEWMLGGSQSRSERFGQDRYLLPVPVIEYQTLSLPFTSSVMNPNVFLNISHSATYDVPSSLQPAVRISHTSRAVSVASQRVILSSDRTMQCLSIQATWSDGLYSFVSITKYLVV